MSQRDILPSLATGNFVNIQRRYGRISNKTPKLNYIKNYSYFTLFTYFNNTLRF